MNNFNITFNGHWSYIGTVLICFIYSSIGSCTQQNEFNVATILNLQSVELCYLCGQKKDLVKTLQISQFHNNKCA